MVRAAVMGGTTTALADIVTKLSHTSDAFVE